MNNQKVLLTALGILLVVASFTDFADPQINRGKGGIRRVEFRNFSYPVSRACTEDLGNTVIVRNGKFVRSPLCANLCAHRLVNRCLTVVG